MVEIVIKYHKEFIEHDLYEFIDPNFKSNSLKGYIPSQIEIIKYIQTNDFDTIDIKYDNKYIIKYSVINNNLIKLSPLEVNSTHLIRLLGLKKITNYQLELDISISNLHLPDMLIELCSLINGQNKINCMDYCTICVNELKLKGLGKISCCSLNKCKTKSKHIVMDNRITDLYKKDPYLCEILIDILIEGTTHPKEEKIFKPLPIIENISNLVELKKLIQFEIANLSIVNISNCSNDIELNKNIGSNAYAIISNAISDNYFSLSTIERFQTEILGTQRLERVGEENVFNSKNVKFIGLNYSYEIESKFKKEYFLFHGTPMYSWYPIVKNGLKVMSGTEFMANGAAYGNGIYLSNQFSMSLGYSSRPTNNSYDQNNKSKKTRSIVGVFEILEGIEKHKKCENIYVISDDKIMLLRYLIVVEKNLDSRQNLELSDYFIKYLGSINKINEKKSINIKNKRFNAEMKLLNNNDKVSNVEIIEEISNWKIELNEIKGNKIKLNIYFSDYPKLPPKMFLECNNLNQNIKINICDNDSNIMIPEINPSQWEITTNLSKISDIIHNYLINLL
jgi:hypothetical protein